MLSWIAILSQGFILFLHLTLPYFSNSQCLNLRMQSKHSTSFAQQTHERASEWIEDYTYTANHHITSSCFLRVLVLVLFLTKMHTDRDTHTHITSLVSILSESDRKRYIRIMYPCTSRRRAVPDSIQLALQHKLDGGSYKLVQTLNEVLFL